MTEKLPPMTPRQRGTLIEALSSSLSHGGRSLSTFPEALDRALDENVWHCFITRDGRQVKHDSFESFVQAQPLRGLGADMAMVKRVIGDNIPLLGQARPGDPAARR